MKKRELHRLTAKGVANRRTQGRYADGGGLYLQVGPTGTKSWLFRYMLGGNAREMGLGPLNTVPLASSRVVDGKVTREIRGARDLAADARRLLLAGIDPIEARREGRADERLASAKSKPFRECAEEYILAHRAEWKNEKHAAQWENTLKTYAYPKIGHLPVSSIDTGLVLLVLEQQVNVGTEKKPRLESFWRARRETASRLRGRIESILDSAKLRELREGDNPARWRGHLDNALPKQSRSKSIKHHPALPYDEAPAFLTRLQTFGGVSPLALQFIIFTASRTGEAIGARWSEISERAKCWTVPAVRMKAAREHKVPLSDAAIAVLATVKPFATGDFVFPSSRGDQPLSNMACLEVLRRMGREDITVHGFRSTFRDWAEERTSFPSHVAEMALAHAIADKVEAAYRRGDLYEKRIRLMDAWAQFLQQPASASVHHIGSKRRRQT